MKNQEDLRRKLSPEAYRITQENGTEAPFTGQYDQFFGDGIYVDIVSGQPLFTSQDKYDSGCGWPAFTRPIDGAVLEKKDNSLGMERVEVRSQTANSHLGHVFTDGPSQNGGLRYCINSAALRFIPIDKLAEEGYGDLLPNLNTRGSVDLS